MTPYVTVRVTPRPRHCGHEPRAQPAIGRSAWRVASAAATDPRGTQLSRFRESPEILLTTTGWESEHTVDNRLRTAQRGRDASGVEIGGRVPLQWPSRP